MLCIHFASLLEAGFAQAFFTGDSSCCWILNPFGIKPILATVSVKEAKTKLTFYLQQPLINSVE